MIINTYSTALDSNLGNSLVFDLSAIDDSWTLIKTLSGTSSDNYYTTDFNNYNKLAFILASGMTVMFATSNKYENSQYYENQRLALSNPSNNQVIVIVVDKSIIPTDAKYYGRYNSQLVLPVYGK